MDRRPHRCLLATALLSISLVLPLQAAIIHVPGDQPTIQAGLDAAGSGDMVLVAAGTYTGAGNKSLDFSGNDIELRSAAGPILTIIDLESSGVAFQFNQGETNAAVVEGFTVSNSSASAVFCTNGSSPTFEDCVFVGNHVDSDGGAVRCNGLGTVRFIGCRFQNNTAGNGGAMAFLGSEATPSLIDCTLLANTATYGGAISMQGASPTIEGCTFLDNSSSDFGGAIYCNFSATPSLTDCWFESNESNAGGGMYCVTDCSPVVDGCTFVQETANVGGVFNLNASTISVTSSTFYGNSAAAGSAAVLSVGSTATFANSILSYGVLGEAILCASGGSAELSCCDIFGNAGGDWVNCLAGQLGSNGNIADDPLFCNAGSNDFTLDASSPNAPPQSGACGLIGAWGIGCGATPVEQTTWGALKTTFR